ncbi:MAG: sensor histidine kinase [Sedimentibacter sp.]
MLRYQRKGVVISFLCNSNEEWKNTDFNSSISSTHELSNEDGGSKDNICEAIVQNEDMEKQINNDELLLDEPYELSIPIINIYSAAQLIEQNLEINCDEIFAKKINQSIDLIKQNCLRLLKLANNSWDLIKIKEKKLELNLSDVNIVEMLENIIDNIHNITTERQLNIIFETNVEEKIILCDVEKIEKVFLNIISNVVKYSLSGGNICISVVAKDKIVEITVDYEGPIIRETELFLSKSFIEFHEGKLILNNNLNKRNIILLELPSVYTNTIYHLYNKSNIINDENLSTMINIEFSDINNAG